MNDLRRRGSAWADGRRGDGAAAPDLPYVIELWTLARTEVERVVARADSAGVARAIFKAAAEENPLRRVVLRQGSKIIDERN